MKPHLAAAFLHRFLVFLLLGALAAPVWAATPMVAAGLRHTLALKSDGTLWAWGWNASGQLGDGTTTDRSSPVKIGEGFTQVAAGLSWQDSSDSFHDGHSLALKEDGSLWAWGGNTYGQLGDGTTTQRSSPVKIGDGYVSVSAGAHHSVAIKADGSLWAWGGNEFGQLGDGTKTDRHTPVNVFSGYRFTQAVAAYAYTIAINTTPGDCDGNLWAWGGNAYGQFGDMTTTDSYITKLDCNWGSGWSKLYATNAHTVAIASNSELWAWGHNNYGQLGDGTTTDWFSHFGTGYVQATAGTHHTAAIKTDGSLWTWGRNNYGQLGDGTTTERHTPVKIGDAYALVSGGAGHTVALKADGSVWAWGENNYGQIGDGTTTQRLSPVQVVFPVTLASLAVSGPATLTAGGTAQFTANATYSDKSSKAVGAVWSVTGGGASIDAKGLLSTGEAAAGTALQVTASYTEQGTTRTATAKITVKAATLTGAECLFAWAEKTYPDVLAPAGAATQNSAPYTYRYYAGTKANLGTSAANNHLYYLGPLSKGAILDLGSTDGWMQKAGCK